MSALNPPHGGELVNLYVDDARAAELKAAAKDWRSWDLTPRQMCDLELLLDGGFSPLRGFMTEVEHASVCKDMRLPDGTLWPIPITLDVDAETAAALHVGAKLALRDAEGVMLAVLDVEDVYEPDRSAEAAQVFGTSDATHPGVNYLVRHANPWYVGGTLQGVTRPHHYDFTDVRLTPAQLRERFEARGWDRVVAFQTRNPMHRAHQELTMRAARDADAALLIHPVVGMTKPGDVDHFTRVRCYEALLAEYPADLADLSLLPLAMRMGGPREALWHAIIRKNYGCTHLIVGRDHAGPGNDANGEPFYGPYDAQELLKQHTEELGIEMVPFRMMVYLPGEDRYAPVDEVPEGTETAAISGTQVREMLASGAEIPSWFTPPAVAAELRRTHPPRLQQGFTVFFTGLSGSGKSTIANVLQTKLLELGGRSVTILDGDLVRKHLSSELGFSKEHRDINIRRIGFVASEVTKHGGIAVCAPIAPYDHTRQDVRAIVESGGGFVLVHVATPVEVCEQRDRKGLYAKARAGIIKEFTGISDPYEEPTDAEVTIDTTACSPEEAAEQVLDYLRGEGYLGK
ncbi:MAG TPA: bifunctional sulfate adenylyltransferase/adenylylsulfate kinase [Euzebyales bacterium]|nr:bifunctional sulfate adenylyltransferase/adenylylsulfate kinase [Euzebyales bacterium]